MSKHPRHGTKAYMNWLRSKRKTGKAKKRKKRHTTGKARKKRTRKHKHTRGPKIKHVLVMKPRRKKHRKHKHRTGKHKGHRRKKHGHRIAGPGTGGSFFAAHKKLV